MALGSGSAKSFLHHVQGTPGAFETPAGKVQYILTKAKLGKESVSPERRLTKHLTPVREVMQSEDLDFNQLLQRDLDDHRVATALIPYLLSGQPTGPAFFPPIVAVLLPFDGRRPGAFPAFSESIKVSDAAQLDWLEQDSGEAFRVRRLADEHGQPHSIAVGQLWWNNEHSRLVVLDGQHRAMALLAIERTQQRSWQGSGGERYRYFYESRVKALLKEDDVDLDSVEVPVVVAWFPELVGDGARTTAHAAARKLFVDVNKEARQPSESRLILLSDAELINVLTRSLLTALRNDESGAFLPLYAVEYDNPVVNGTRPARWSVLTNIHLLKQAVLRTVFGHPKYLRNVTLAIGGREALPERDLFMRQQLELTKILPPTIEDGGYTYKRDEIGNTNFPLGQADEILKSFQDSWGESLLILMSDLLPYKAHADALNALREAWHPDEAVSSLAYDALFGGVGMYWTLKESADYFRKEETEAVGIKPAKPDIVKAWELIVSKQDDFDVQRSLHYLGSSSAKSLHLSADAYAIMNTHACQLGLALALGTIWLEVIQDTDKSQLPDFTRHLVQGLNAWFGKEHGKVHDHRLVMSRSVPHPLNVITSMDTPRAIQFRYFWMELIASAEVRETLTGWSMRWDKYEALLTAARSDYFRFCVEAQTRALKTTHPDWSDAVRSAEADKVARAALAKSLRDWFGVTMELVLDEAADNELESEDSDASDEDSSMDAEGSAETTVASLEELMTSDE
jgi:hypothetical protein